MNALAYGWTRGNFLSAMSAQPLNTGGRSNSLTTSLGERDEEEDEEGDGEEEKEVYDERGEWNQRSELSPGNSLLLSLSRARDSVAGERRQRGNTALTPVS